MLKNYIKTAFRNLVHSKTHSLINIIGLSVGMATAMLIGLWIWSELSFDKYHKNYERIARLMQHQTVNGEINTLKAMPIPAALELRQSFGSEFKYIILSSWTNFHVLSFKDKHMSMKGNFMEPDAPDMLSLEMKYGSKGGLKDPSSILLSASSSKAIFGDANPIDKILKLDSTDVKITGVFEDLPINSSFNNISFIAPWSLYGNSDEIKQATYNWNHNSFQIFVQVADNKDIANVSARIKDIKFDKADQKGKQLKPQVFLHPMKQWHLYDEFKDGFNTGGNIQYVWLFGIIGAFVLFLACINFMNLSTARSQKRAKEVGIRKTIGSLKGQLIAQFFSESLLMAALAFALSLLMVQITLPFFNEVSDKKLFIPWTNPVFWMLASGFTIFTGLIAGSYPALYLSSFRPVKVLKGSFRIGSLASFPRKVLVVLQFTISIIMIIGTIVVFRQVKFAKNRPAGYNSEGLILVRPYTEDFHTHFNAIRNDLLQTGLITEVAESGNQITQSSRTIGGYEWKGKVPSISDEFSARAVSPEYGKTVGWKLIAGRDFSRTSRSDSLALIVNEAAVKYMRLTNPVGETVSLGDSKFTIIGVVKDMIAESPYDPVKQTLFYFLPESGLLNIRIKAGVRLREALDRIEAVCKKYSPAAPFDYKFVNEEYIAKFAAEERIGQLASIFSVLAIFISCLGLFGLASFIAEQRTKEIGLRKVLGASVFSVWRLLSKDFALLVIISLIIATPTAYYFMNHWLENYQYRSEISLWIFAIAGLGAMLMTLITVSFHAIKAAIANPTEALRSQ
jgi:putative ABC transport system permease protein